MDADLKARHYRLARIAAGDASDRVAIIFETRAGPAGDNRYDWARRGAPRLIKHQEHIAYKLFLQRVR